MPLLKWKLWLFFLFELTIGAPTVELEYDQGILIGSLKQGKNVRPFYAFKGIPYARPPIGELRFKDPVGDVKWKGLRDGYWDPPRCPQMVNTYFVGDEDCLYLNVFTPQIGSKRYPVMVFFHGGNFLNGGAEDYSPLPLMSKDIVLVVPQYRLGVLGFLTTEEEELPGNFGLKDQTMALIWVQEHIRQFGGDPNEVTIFGTGSGAASVHYQILSPYSLGLFSRAIIQSGSSLCPKTIRKQHEFFATELYGQFSCASLNIPGPSSFTNNLTNCLKKVPAKDLTFSYNRFLVWHTLPALNVPRVDGDFIPDHPGILLKEGRYNPVDIMIGFNKHDGSVITSPLYRYPSLMKEFKHNFLSIGSLALSFDEEEHPAYLAGIPYSSYMRGKCLQTHEGADRITKLFTDRLFGVCIHDTLEFHANTLSKSKVYAYQLVHRGKESTCKDQYTPLDDKWICHNDEMQYLFNNFDGFPLLENKDDIQLGNTIVSLWTNFAIYGNPTPDKSLGFSWDQFSTEKTKWLELKPEPSLSLIDYSKIRLYWHSLPFGKNEDLYPEEFGAQIDLDFIDQDAEYVENHRHEPIFSSSLDIENALGKQDKWTRVFNDLETQRQRDQTEISTNNEDNIIISHETLKPESIYNMEDLIEAAALWNVEIFPGSKPSQKRQRTRIARYETSEKGQRPCQDDKNPGQKYQYHNTQDGEACEILNPYFDQEAKKYNINSRNCNLKKENFIDERNNLILVQEGVEKDAPLELNMYNMIQSGFLEANILLRGLNAGDEERIVTVNKDNLEEIIKSYGYFVKEQLEQRKVTQDQLNKILSTRKNTLSQKDGGLSGEDRSQDKERYEYVKPETTNEDKKETDPSLDRLMQVRSLKPPPQLDPSSDGY